MIHQGALWLSNAVSAYLTKCLNLLWPDRKNRKKLSLLPLLHLLHLLPFCFYRTATLSEWALSISVTTSSCSTVFILKIRPGVLSRSYPLLLLWLAVWALECVRLVFDWSLLWNRAHTAVCGGGWPQFTAPHIIAFNITGETQNWPWIKVTGSLIVFPQKRLVSNLWPISSPLSLSLSCNPQVTLFLQSLKESVGVMSVQSSL